MKIKTKYNIGDEVWFILNGRIAEFIVSQIHVVKTDHNTYVTYNLHTKNEPIITFDAAEKFLFSTKEELLKSL